MKVLSQEMRMGDRIMVEPVEGEPFEATVQVCLGWGLVNGVLDWGMNSEEHGKFAYGVRVDTEVEVLNR